MTLKEFYADKEIRNAVKDYIDNFISAKTIELVFERKDTMGLADAKDFIEGAFEQLEADFAPKPKKRDLNNAI